MTPNRRGHMASYIARRELLAALGGAVAAWPLAANAQQGARMRRVGVLMSTAADDPEGQARIAAFAQGLQQTGWVVWDNVRVDIRFGADNANLRKYAGELAASAPDVILAVGSSALRPSFRLQGLRPGP